MYINSCQFCGNLVADPKPQTDTREEPYTKFTLALNKPRASRPIYIDCVAWGKIGQVIAEYHRRGEELYVSGELSLGSYVDKEGVKRKSVSLIVREFSAGRIPRNSNAAELRRPALPALPKAE